MPGAASKVTEGLALGNLIASWMLRDQSIMPLSMVLLFGDGRSGRESHHASVRIGTRLILYSIASGQMADA